MRDLVYFTNGFHLPKDAQFESPVHYEPFQGDPNHSDTSVVVYMQAGRCSGDTGQITLFYKRLFLNELIPMDSDPIVLPLQNFLLSSILPQINAKYAINLDVTDIIDRECTVSDGSFILQANPNSLAWQNELPLYLKFTLFASVTTFDLSGFVATPAS